MTARTIIFWRHGRTAYNAQGRLQGQVDIPLDEIGQWQIETAAEELASHVRTMLGEGANVRIVSSDLMRAAATAEALATKLEVSVNIDERLREQAFGEWEGLTRDEIQERWPEAAAVWLGGGARGGKGAETRGEAGTRVAEVAIETAQAMENRDIVILVSHGAAITSGITSLLGLDPEQWRGFQGLNNAFWSVLLGNPGNGAVHGGLRVAVHNQGPRVPIQQWVNGPEAK